MEEILRQIGRYLRIDDVLLWSMIAVGLGLLLVLMLVFRQRRKDKMRLRAEEMADRLRPDILESPHPEGGAGSRMRQNTLEAHAMLGLARIGRHQLVDAVTVFTETLRHDPGNPDVLCQRAVALLLLGRGEESLDDVGAALRKDPSQGQGHLVRATAFLETGELDEAVASGQRAIQLKDHADAARQVRGVALAALGQWERALPDLEASANVQWWTRGLAAQHLASIYAGCPDEEIRDGDKALHFAELSCDLFGWQDWSSLSLLAAAHAEKGEFDEAIKRAQEALELAPEKEKVERWERIKQYRAGSPYRFPPADAETVR